jgi:hypothetical protein
VKYIEELPATCCLFAARKPAPKELRAKDLAKHLASLVVDTVSEEDLKRVNDRYESWRLYEAKRFDSARRQLSHAFYVRRSPSNPSPCVRYLLNIDMVCFGHSLLCIWMQH